VPGTSTSGWKGGRGDAGSWWAWRMALFGSLGLPGTLPSPLSAKPHLHGLSTAHRCGAARLRGNRDGPCQGGGG
jgi:hypothetical protein